MTDEQKLQDYQEMLELVKIHLGIDYKYLTLFYFKIELEEFITKVNDAERIKQEIDNLTSVKVELNDEISDLENEVRDLKKELKELKNKNLKNNES